MLIIENGMRLYIPRNNISTLFADHSHHTNLLEKGIVQLLPY